MKCRLPSGTLINRGMIEFCWWSLGILKFLSVLSSEKTARLWVYEKLV